MSSEEARSRLAELVREKVRAFVQEIIEEEVTAALGLRKSEHGAEVEGVAGYRNG